MPKLTARVIVAIVIVAAVVLLLLWGPAACNRIRSLSAQSKVDQAQGGAFHNSAGDAVSTQGGVNANATATEDLTRSNRDDILKAEGAGDRVNPAVRDAGVRALCARRASRNDPRCRVQPTPAR